jgi:peptide/nickel transport system substrate-binding protein
MTLPRHSEPVIESVVAKAGLVRQTVIAGAVVALVLLALFLAGGGSAAATPQTPLGPLRYDLDTDIDYVDPALAYYVPTWQLEYATCAKLLNYPDAPAPVGSRLVPEIAGAMPTVSADGRTYSFTIRDDFWFSPPAVGERVTAQSMKYTFERTLDRRMSSPAQPFFDDIVGAQAFISGAASEISGIVAHGDTLTITLLEPAGDFLGRVAMPFTCAVPLSLPIDPDGVPAPVPSAGPYYIAAWSPRQSILALRNPHYAGSRPRHFDSFEYSIGYPPATTLQRIHDGLADHGPVPPSAHADLAPRYGPNSPAAQRGRQQWFAEITPTIRYLAMNTERPLFANRYMRQAVNFALHRPALAAQRGEHAGVLTDQYVPPNIPGFRDEAIYPLDGPNVVRAQELVALAGGPPDDPAVIYTCTAAVCIASAQIIQANLRAIGIDSTILAFPRATQFTRAGTRGEPFDITLEGWRADFLDPWSFIQLMDGRTIRPMNNINFSYFNDPGFVARMEAAENLTGAARLEALGQLDVDLARDGSPLAVYMNDNDRDFFSERIGCQVQHPIYDTNLAALCVRPAISIDDVSVTEPESSTANAVLTVRLSSQEPAPVTVAFQTVDESASGGSDYTTASGTVTFVPGDSKAIAVAVNADALAESTETFAVVLSDESRGTVVDRATVTVVDRPPPPAPQPPQPPLPQPPPPPQPQPIPPPAQRFCRVPGVVGRTLRAARTAIRRANCRVGRIRNARSRRARGRVIRQAPRRGARLRVGARVNLVVSRGRR